MHLGDERSRRGKADAYVDLLGLVDEFRSGIAGRIHRCTLGFRRVDSPPVLTLDFFLGHAVQLVHVWEDLCEVHPGRS